MYAINSMLDEMITKQLRNYMAEGRGDKDEVFSDVQVKDGDVALTNVYGKPEQVNARLALEGLPLRVACVHCKSIKISIPWLHMSSGFVEVSIEEVLLLLQPSVYERSADELRQTKEIDIVRAIEQLLKRHEQAQETEKKAKKASFFARLKAQLEEHLRPRIRVSRVHVRYEQFGTPMGRSRSAQAMDGGFALGFLLHRCLIEKDAVETSIQVKLDSVGMYCRTTASGERPLISSTPHSSEPGFFAAQRRVGAQLANLLDEAVTGWHPDGWLVGPLHAQCTVHKATFDAARLDTPMLHAEVVLQPLHVHVDEHQASAVCAVQSLLECSRLWSSYALLQPDAAIGRPSRTNRVATQHYWQAAGWAVSQVVSRSYSSRRWRQSMEQKRSYLELLKRMYKAAGVDEADDVDGPEEAARVRAFLSTAERAELQRLEDTVGVHALAWWRLLAIAGSRESIHAAAAERRKHQFATFGRIGARLGNRLPKEFLDATEVNALGVLKVQPRDDGLHSAPAGYTRAVVQLTLEQLSLHLVRRPAIQTKIQSEIEIQAEVQVEELFGTHLRGLAATCATRHQAGAVYELSLRELVAYSAAHPAEPLIAIGSAAELGPVPSVGLASTSSGGVAGRAGMPVMPEASAAQPTKAGRRLFSVRRKEPGSSKGSNGGSGVSPQKQKKAAGAVRSPSSDEAPSDARSPPARHMLDSSLVDTGARAALPATASPALHVRAGRTVRAGAPGAGEVAVAVGRVQVVHDPSSWDQLERYFAAAAEVAHRSALLESSRRHSRAAMLLRAMCRHGAVRPAWHMPEAQVLSLVNSSALLLILQPQCSTLDIELSGGSLRLVDPATAPHSEDPGLLSIALPALSVCRRAQSGGGSRAEVRFAAPLVFDTPVSGATALATRMQGAARDRPSLHAAGVLQEALQEAVAQHAQYAQHAQHAQHAAAARQGGWAAAAPLAAAPQAAAASNQSKEPQARDAAPASMEARHPSERGTAMRVASEAAAEQPRPGWLQRFLSEQQRCLRCCLPAQGTA